MPTVTNGMAMCPTHHRAYDRDILLVTEEYRVQVRRDQLDHVDHEPPRRFIVDFDGRPIGLPKDELRRQASQDAQFRLHTDREAQWKRAGGG